MVASLSLDASQIFSSSHKSDKVPQLQYTTQYSEINYNRVMLRTALPMLIICDT